MIPNPDSKDWVVIRNDSGETIPPYSAVEVSGVLTAGSAAPGAFSVICPSTDDCLHVVFTNGHEIPAGAFGLATAKEPFAVEVAGSHGPGAMVGTAAGDFGLASSGNGFLVLA
jgi:hypothetical protein